ncbi:peptidoglycan-associated lipoprotein [Desulfosarcina sp. BuS5]|uniref:peptidoglycan-associated lipoprotein Pal n=1 Tax=Desulfosarcina sp. BuS5 TaxID=933262 RepID=UPI00048931FD|nr:peptidoglycan-associated lipoprotein Pal [Desulfosarcina sp. BuS5]WDN89169.1 peptidoglycan-associated lipoprotein [Desulfosarcina sp. BuS5]
MQKRLWINLMFCFILPAMLFTASCAKKVVSTEPTTDQMIEGDTDQLSEVTDVVVDESSITESDLMKAEALAAQEKAAQEKAAREMFVSADIHFEFDSAVLSSSAQDILKLKGAWMLNNPGVSVIVEGHCDERGTSEYNIALGDRRADSAKQFIVDLGVAPERLTTISYGEERPLDPAKNEAAWAINRRAHFTLE